MQGNATLCSYFDKHISLPDNWTRFLSQHDCGVIIVAISALSAKFLCLCGIITERNGIFFGITVQYKYRRYLRKEIKIAKNVTFDKVLFVVPFLKGLGLHVTSKTRNATCK